ncbi:MAG: hypothetical protein KGR26_13095, partial [Cyanobacteria bacterium REEB65]|nr:hypothetical protein [Cyanobacteria bacterium REEB65]
MDLSWLCAPIRILLLLGYSLAAGALLFENRILPRCFSEESQPKVDRACYTGLGMVALSAPLEAGQKIWAIAGDWADARQMALPLLAAYSGKVLLARIGLALA